MCDLPLVRLRWFDARCALPSLRLSGARTMMALVRFSHSSQRIASINRSLGCKFQAKHMFQVCEHVRFSSKTQYLVDLVLIRVMIRPANANALSGGEHARPADSGTLSAVSDDQILSEAGPGTRLSPLAVRPPERGGCHETTSAVTVSRESSRSIRLLYTSFISLPLFTP